jgi:MoxR-like ATPase
MNSPNQSNVTTFQCVKCSKRLNVPATAIGAQAKCPECGMVQTVPSTALNPSPPVGAATPISMTGAHGSSPSAAQMPQQPASPFGAPDSPSAPTAEGKASGLVGHSRPTAGGGEAVGAVEAAAPDDASSSAAELTIEPPTGSVHRETETKRLFDRMTEQIAKIYVGQDELVLGTLVALFSAGHILIESVPGLGKTLFIRTLARVLGCEFGRIQFTADLMPSDITGAPLFDMKTQEFRFRPGPVFTQLLLADEINRSPAKTHAALLEIMQEYRVTVDGQTHLIDRPFLVMATQNPIESEGTYNLPEAQLDRFMFKLVADYPLEAEEARILSLHSQQLDLEQRLNDEVEVVTSQEEIIHITRENSKVRVEASLLDYINKIVRRTREWQHFHMGASPRAGLALMQSARTLAAFQGRDYAVPDDVVRIALPALRHRVILTAEAEVEGHQVDVLLSELIRSVEVPRI